MLDKIYKLKNSQKDQKLITKKDLLFRLDSTNEEIEKTQHKINTTSVNKYGAISDFTILEMHKQTLKLHLQKLKNQKKNIENSLEMVEYEIVELQKESEQFKYLIEEEKKRKTKEMLKNEQLASEEFIQSKYT